MTTFVITLLRGVVSYEILCGSKNLSLCYQRETLWHLHLPLPIHSLLNILSICFLSPRRKCCRVDSATRVQDVGRVLLVISSTHLQSAESSSSGLVRRQAVYVWMVSDVIRPTNDANRSNTRILCV